MRYAAIVLIALCCTAMAKTRTELTKVVKADTLVAQTPDSTRLVWDDSLKITLTYQDTSIIIKRDTVRTHSASRLISKPVKK